MRVVIWLVALCAGLCSIPCSGAEPDELKTSELARAFGAAPFLWGAKLSPDGSKLSVIQMHPSGVTLARVFDLAGTQSAVVLSGKRDEFDVTWCDWANDERLLCGLRGITRVDGILVPFTRIVGTDTDGNEIKVLVERHLSDTFTQFQDRVIDWLPGDPEHVLVQIPTRGGSGVARLNVYSGGFASEDRERANVYTWISDGYGTPRLYQSIDERVKRWFVRDTPDAAWGLLRENELTDLNDTFSPVGFGENRNELFFFDKHEGRTALFALDLANGRQRRLVYAHEEFDVANVHMLGKYERIVAAAYVDDRPRLRFFDSRIAAIDKAVGNLFPGDSVAIIDESWDQRYYLVYVTSATNPGVYYRFDTQANILAKLSNVYPALAGRTLAPMQFVHYPAADGTQIPAYLTLPSNREGPGAAVILPHGGPSSRDYWAYDFLAQYLAASGYAVLQSNYRGSDGYGDAWQGEGGFRNWRQAIADITDGTKYLIAEGIAAPERICAVGWSYGGYAALLSVIEQPQMYRCVASIAGVTDPKRLSFAMRNYVGGRSAAAFIGTSDEVQQDGSPLERAQEIQVPVLLVHAEKDINVPIQQSTVLARALRDAKKNAELIEYQHAEHDISPERYRIDLLARLGEFLALHLAR